MEETGKEEKVKIKEGEKTQNNKKASRKQMEEVELEAERRK